MENLARSQDTKVKLDWPTKSRQKDALTAHVSAVAARVGSRLSDFRHQSDLTAAQVSKKLGVCRATLYRFENGLVIHLSDLFRIAMVIGVSPAELMRDDECVG